MMRGRLQTIALWIAIALSLTQCVPTRDITVAYQPPLRVAKEPDPKLPPVSVLVLEKRPSTVVGHPLGALGEKEGFILSENDAIVALKKAFDIELKGEGFTIGAGGNEMVVDLSFFQSQYLHPLFHTRAVGSIGIDVTVRRPDGAVAYQSFILGQSEKAAETHFESTETWASDVLNAAMSDAIQKTLADPDFQNALRTR